MRKIHTKLLYILFALAVIGGSTVVTSKAYAETYTGQNKSISSLVQKIADTFGLKVSDVKAVFDEQNVICDSQRNQGFEEKLSKAVANGSISEVQKTLILNKRAELEAKRASQFDSIKGMSQDERKKQRDAERLELENWASQNNIDVKYLMFGFGKGIGNHGKRDHMGGTR